MREKREALGMTQWELGERAGLGVVDPKRTIGRIERRQHYPTQLTKDKLAFALRTNVDDLFPRHA